jgi:hypothetical protein
LLKLLEGIKEETGGQNQFMQMPTPNVGKSSLYKSRVPVFKNEIL